MGRNRDSRRQEEAVVEFNNPNHRLNLADKETLNRPWDVHSERLLECVHCHFAVNNPAHQSAVQVLSLALPYSPRNQ